MKQGWEIKKLGNVCTILNGGTPNTKVPEYWGGEHLWITPKDMGKLNSIYVDETERKITDEGLRNSSAKLLPINSIIVSTRAPIGHLAINRKLISTNQGCKGVVPSDEINTLYLFDFLKNSVKLLNNLGRGTTFKELSSSKLSSVEIPIPTLPEQERIVAKLDQCFEAIDQAKTNVERKLQNAKELFQSQLNQIFSKKGEGWVEKKLGNLGKITSSKRIYKREYVKEGIPFFRTKEIKELANEKEISLELYITREKYNEIKKTFGVPSEGDILLSAVGTIGEIYVVKKDDEFYFKDGNLIWLKDFNDVDAYYLKYTLMSFVDQIKALSHGSAYNALTIEKLNEYTVNLPSIETQKSIVTKLDKLKRKTLYIESNYQQELNALDELKESILQKAFNGEL